MWLEYLKAIGFLITAIGVFLAYYQLRKTIRWNKLNAGLSFFSHQTIIEREEAAVAALAAYGITHHQQTDPLPDDVVKRLIDDPVAYRAIKGLLNLFEEYALAVRLKILDEDAAFKLMSLVLVRHFHVFEPFIRARRKTVTGAALWQEFELVARDWEPRLLAENQDLIDKQIEAKKHYEDAMRSFRAGDPPKPYAP